MKRSTGTRKVTVVESAMLRMYSMTPPTTFTRELRWNAAYYRLDQGL